MTTEKKPKEETIFLNWPLDQLITFASAMNLLKKTPRKDITRYGVHKNIEDNEAKFSKYFQKNELVKKQVYNYMDNFIEEGYFVEISKFQVGSTYIQRLTSTPKADILYKWLWMATNLKSEEDIGKIVNEEIKTMNLTEEEKKHIVKAIVDGVETKRMVGFPFSISKEAIDELLMEKSREQAPKNPQRKEKQKR
jgi:hypothetical protein